MSISSGAAVAAPSGQKSAWAIVGVGGLRQYGLVVGLYVAATYFTDVVYMGDTGGYANLIMTSTFTELLSKFGHLLWLLLGSIVSVIAQPFTGMETRLRILSTLLILGWIAGLMSACLIYNLAYRVARREWVAALVTVAFISGQGFLNFAQTGCSYVPGLSMALLGLWLLFRAEDKPEPTRASGIAAGIAFAASVGLWVPYILAIPGMLLSPLFIFGLGRRRAGIVMRAAVIFGLVCGAFYGSAAALQGIRDLAGIEDWVFSAGRDINISGFHRMVFGFARSFVNMANDGVLFKRFLLHDPFNPVSFLDLLRLSLGKFLLFYSFFALSMAALLQSWKGRRFFGFFAVSALPLFLFAWKWQGGDMERYFPIYPAFFLALAYLLSEGPWLLLCRWAAAIWIIACVGINGSAMAKTKSLALQQRVVARTQEILPRWKPESRIATVLAQDDLFKFPETFFFHPLNSAQILGDRGPGTGRVFNILGPGSADGPKWRQIFAHRVFSAWSAGGDVWVSKEAFAPRPGPGSAWVEGDDPRTPWREIYDFFSQLETSAPTGGQDGFFLLPQSPKNRQFLARWMTS